MKGYNEKIEYPNGNTYWGDTLRGIPDGEGILYDAQQRVIYEGQWKKGEYHGNGICTNLDGDTYEGEWKNGQRNGRGRMCPVSGGGF